MPDRQKVEFDLPSLQNAELWAWQALKEYQKAKDDLEILKESGKDYLASLMTEISEGSEAQRERLARTSEKWVHHRNSYFAAIQTCGEAHAKYQSAVRFWDTVISGLAFRREELKKLQ